ncbi:hypothetical protein OH76DRAFT_1473608 [Lentinus brumalis]|uniref:F-box domain-containing protein n=1 Tax=Lentinus brumalis TaxID=2498619 RepID=A0A371D0B9_9APHY|nr:hypothetical protein OH76DRAFT_1473608 [Polyporus brumalis]
MSQPTIPSVTSSGTAAPLRQYAGIGCLNLDVWSLVLEQLSTMNEEATHLLAAMQTCRDLYKLGLKVLLDRGVVLMREAAAQSFCRFLEEDNHSRAPLLQRLVLDISSFSETTLQTLRVLLQNAARLRGVVIYVSNGSFNALDILQPSASTLRSAHISYLNMRDWAGITLPNLQYLETDLLLLPASESLIRTFPKLTHLKTQLLFWDGEYGDLVDEDARNANIQTQEQRGSWPYLKSASGQLRAIFALGLTCPVSRLVLQANPPSDAGRVMLSSLLDRTPELKELVLTTNDDIFGLGWPFIRMERLYEKARLEEFPEEGELLADRTRQGLRDIFDEHHLAFQQSTCKLQQLSMTVDITCPVFACYNFDDAPQPRYSDCPVLKQICMHDVSAEADLLLQDVPTLQQVELRVFHHGEELHYQKRTVVGRWEVI